MAAVQTGALAPGPDHQQQQQQKQQLVKIPVRVLLVFLNVQV
jgi:hypothetical protein